VDADYIARSGDTTFQLGQRLVLRKAAVAECLDLVEKLTLGLANDAANSP